MHRSSVCFAFTFVFAASSILVAEDELAFPQAEKEHPVASKNVAKVPGERHEARKRQKICVDHPVRRDLRHRKIALDGGKGNADHGLVEDDETEHATHGTQDPIFASVAARARHPPSLARSDDREAAR